MLQRLVPRLGLHIKSSWSCSNLEDCSVSMVMVKLLSFLLLYLKHNYLRKEMGQDCQPFIQCVGGCTALLSDWTTNQDNDQNNVLYVGALRRGPEVGQILWSTILRVDGANVG